MRKVTTLLLLGPLLAFSQTQLLSTSPENRSVLLEHFTGINSGDGVIGYDAALDIIQADPFRVAMISYHAGGGAQPVASQPDFQTTEGTTINNYFSVQQHPRGVVGRRPYQSQFAIHFNAYDITSSLVKSLSSPVNLGMSCSFDAATRDLSVDVEVYYTANSPGMNDYISVVLVESNLIAWQQDFYDTTGAGGDSTYSHQWLFREPITAIWGDEVQINTAGHSETRTYMINVSTDYDISNCYVVAHIGELQEDVYQAKFVAADGGSTQVGITENEFDTVLGEAFPVPALDQVTVPFFKLLEDATLRITDAQGKLISDRLVAAGTQQVTLDVSNWAAGMYSYQIISESGKSAKARMLQVL